MTTTSTCKMEVLGLCREHGLSEVLERIHELHMERFKVEDSELGGKAMKLEIALEAAIAAAVELEATGKPASAADFYKSLD